MLHSETYKGYSDPAAKACKDRFCPCFYEIDYICVQSDRCHCHDNEEFAQFLKRGGNCGRKVEYSRYYGSENEEKNEEREGFLETERRAFFFFFFSFPIKCKSKGDRDDRQSAGHFYDCSSF